jgi:hypothetical protein
MGVVAHGAISAGALGAHQWGSEMRRATR